MTVTTKGTATLTLPADDEIKVTREFDAPRHLVYKAWTTPELVAKWWHANRGEVTSVEIDLRVGGTWRWAMRATEGFEVAFHGEYREIVPNERIVTTEVYEGAPDDPSLNTLTFEDIGGRTALTMTIRANSKEARDMIIASGMENGLQDALDLIEELAVSMA